MILHYYLEINKYSKIEKINSSSLVWNLEERKKERKMTPMLPPM